MPPERGKRGRTVRLKERTMADTGALARTRTPRGLPQV
jgi:hypothetical protein